MAIKPKNPGKLNIVHEAASAMEAGTAVKLDGTNGWAAADDETTYDGILAQKTITKPTAYHLTVGTFAGGSFQVLSSEVAYVGDKVGVYYGPGQYDIDQVDSSVTFSVGDAVYVKDGYLHDTAQNSGDAIGFVDETADSDGFVRVTIVR